MSAHLPRNGGDLLRMRHEGWRPNGLVIVSLIGTLRFCNYSLYVNPGVTYDFDMLAGLDVELISDTSVPFPAVLQTLADMASSAPATMALGYVEGPRVDCGQSRFILESIEPTSGRMLFDWFAVAATVGLPDSTRLAKQLRREMGRTLPTPYDAACDHLQKSLEKELRHGADDSRLH